LVDKPEGMTSHDVVASIRGRGRFSKVGHAGTLDPLATGVLVLLIGKATREADRFLQDEKTYEGTLTFGVSTETGDREGKPVRHGTYQHICPEAVKEVFKRLKGSSWQYPPMYSAVKQNGRKLYEWAREGIALERKPRTIMIRTLQMRHFHLPELSFYLVCSKGTYVRTLAETIAEQLGCPGHLTQLRRIQSGMFSVREALSFEEARTMDRKTLISHLLPLHRP